MSWNTPSANLGTHICVNLINLVKQHPIIYLSAKKSASYPRKNRNEVNQIWDNIAEDIGLSAEDCKRRWKGLKDVYAKIRKRRLQEEVLGINARKKWLYEDFMSFMKFPFEKPYQKALENFEEIDCYEWKMEDEESNDTAEETLNYGSDDVVLTNLEEKDQSKVEEEEQIEDETLEYLDLDLEVDSVPDSEGSEPVQSSERDDISQSKIQVQVFEPKGSCGYSARMKPRSKYRAIRPKSHRTKYLSRPTDIRNCNTAVKNSTSSVTPIVSMSNLNPLNQVTVTSQTLQKAMNRDAVLLARPNKKAVNYRTETSDRVSSTSSAAITLGSPKNARVNSTLLSNKRESLLRISAKKSNNGSIELFFRSMAQTVMNLPMQAQAEIKMEICKVVTRAEIQYSLSQPTSTTESRKSNCKSKKG